MEQTLVVIHVRFANDGSVREIGECPSGTSPQDWFNALSRHSSNSYESLSGGRGFFASNQRSSNRSRPQFFPPLHKEV